MSNITTPLDALKSKREKNKNRIELNDFKIFLFSFPATISKCNAHQMALTMKGSTRSILIDRPFVVCSYDAQCLFTFSRSFLLLAGMLLNYFFFVARYYCLKQRMKKNIQYIVNCTQAHIIYSLLCLLFSFVLACHTAQVCEHTT